MFMFFRATGDFWQDMKFDKRRWVLTSPSQNDDVSGRADENKPAKTEPMPASWREKLAITDICIHSSVVLGIPEPQRKKNGNPESGCKK
jgi:hypothetical protein